LLLCQGGARFEGVEDDAVDGRHVHENAAAAAVDLRASLDECEALIPLGPAFT
jgi:hypothetical protein